VSHSPEPEVTDAATVAAYLANRLDPRRAEAFEDYCLRHPDFARQVELDLMLKTGLKQLQMPRKTPFLNARWRAGLGIAAALAVIAACGLLFVSRSQSGTLIAYRSASEVPAQLLGGTRLSATLIRLRGDSAVRRILAPRAAGVLGVRVAPDVKPGRLGYRVGIALEPRVIGRSVTLDSLHPDADGYLEVYLPLAEVADHTLDVTVSSAPADQEEPLSFRLQVAYQ